MSFIDSLLAVLTVIVFLVAVAFVIALVIDLFLAIVAPDTRGLFFRRGHKDSSKEQKKPTMVESEQTTNTTTLDEYDEQNKNKENNWDESLVASEQQKLLSGEQVPQLESKASLEEEREQTIASRQKEMEDFDTLFDEDSSENDLEIESLINEINEYAVNEFKNGAEVEEVKEEAKAQEAAKDEIVEPAEQQEEVRIEQENVIIPASVYSTLTIDQLNARLEKLNARLKLNEKELKANRKEYMPLARVKKTLERDEQKLRRREAIVARKKVILYGVNNYVDIDEEKAKKLSEDLDLLDGLRLSVQHCEDVMATNKDRFPLLETTNQILVQVNRDLKDDIAEIQDAIQAYKQSHPDE